MSVASERQKLDQDQIVRLLTVTHADAGILRFNSSMIDPTDAVVFDGDTYFARQFRVTGLSAQGSKLPRGKLRIDNVDRYWYSLVDSYDEMVGATVNYLEVYRQNLDDGSDPDTAEILSDYTFTIHQMELITRQSVEFRLAASIDRESAKSGRICMRHVCPHASYRSPDPNTADTFFQGTCPYTGSSYFKKDGTSTTDWREDDCGQKRSDCELRYGENTDLPYLGFPGIGQQET